MGSPTVTNPLALDVREWVQSGHNPPDHLTRVAVAIRVNPHARTLPNGNVLHFSHEIRGHPFEFGQTYHVGFISWAGCGTCTMPEEHPIHQTGENRRYRIRVDGDSRIVPRHSTFPPEPRVPIDIHPDVRDRLRRHLMRAPGVDTRGFSQFIEDALDHEGAER